MSARLSSKRRRWLFRHARLSDQRRLLQDRRAKHRRRLGLPSFEPVLSPTELSGVTGAANRKHVRLVAPRIFSLSSNYDPVISFFEGLRREGVERKNRVTLDFNNIRQLSPAAALMLAAEVDRWRRKAAYGLKPYQPKQWHPEIRRLLIENGFFDLLNVPTVGLHDGVVDNSAVRLIKFITGDFAEGEAVDQVRMMTDTLSGGGLADDLLLYDAMSEAVVNAVNHAYPEHLTPGTPWVAKRWWMTGSFDPANDVSSMIVFDQGIGIPNSLPVSNHWEKILQILDGLPVPGLKLSVNRDSYMIKAAVEFRRTSMAQGKGRGNGLAKMCDFVDRRPGSRLRILSGKGEYLYLGNGNDLAADRHKPLGGTLIQWEIAGTSAAISD